MWKVAFLLLLNHRLTVDLISNKNRWWVPDRGHDSEKRHLAVSGAFGIVGSLSGQDQFVFRKRTTRDWPKTYP